MKISNNTLIFTLLVLIALTSYINCKPKMEFKVHNGKKTTNNKRRLIQFSEKLKLWLTQKQIDELGKDGEVNFMDITDHQVVPKTKLPKLNVIPDKLRFQDVVKPIAAKAQKSNIEKTIKEMSEFFNRYYTTQTGEEAAIYLKKRFDDYVSELPPARRQLFDVQFFNHSWRQPSVIVTMKGASKKVGDEIVVIGGHLDSTAGGALRRSPGADDDASGSSTVLEIFRLIAQSDFVPDRSIHFMCYAAEEVGLRGSQDIANAYRRESKKVHAVAQFDMVGFLTRSTVGIITDFTSAPLNAFLKLCITEYSTLKYGDTRCGYACSDHASWTRANYRAVFPFEAYPFNNINRRIHTASDLIEYLDLNDAIEYSKFGVGFAVELSKE